MGPGQTAPPTVSQISTARSPSRPTSRGQTVVAVSNGSAAHRRLRAEFSPPQSPTAKTARRVLSAVQGRQASKAANVTRDAAHGANGSRAGRAPGDGPAASLSAAPALAIDDEALHLGPAAASAASASRAASSSAAPALVSAASATSIDDEVLCLGPVGKDYKKPRLVHVVGSGDHGSSFNVRLATGVELSGVPF